MAKSKTKNANRARQGLPAGFTAMSVGGGFGAWWDHVQRKILQGKILGFDSMMTTQEDDKGREKKIKRGIMRVQDEKGVTLNVGESSAIRELFMPANQKALRGKQVYIRFDGQKKFKNKRGQTRKINQFTVAVK